MSIFSLHIGHKTTGLRDARLRDIGTMTCDYDDDRFILGKSSHGQWSWSKKAPKSRVPKSKDTMVYF
jgi:hypothetical protein